METEIDKMLRYLYVLNRLHSFSKSDIVIYLVVN